MKGLGWCKTCDEIVDTKWITDRDEYECELGHITTGLEIHQHEKELSENSTAES